MRLFGCTAKRRCSANLQQSVVAFVQQLATHLFSRRRRRRRTNGAVMLAVLICVAVDLPRVTGLPPRVYLARGLTGRIDCPVDANPPVTIILWAKNGVMVDDDDGPGLVGGRDGSRGRRLRTSRQGSLFIRSVEETDKGRYVCTPYSPLGKGQTSMPVEVFVRGQSVEILHFLPFLLSHCLSTCVFFIYAICKTSTCDKIENICHSYHEETVWVVVDMLFWINSPPYCKVTVISRGIIQPTGLITIAD